MFRLAFLIVFLCVSLCQAQTKKPVAAKDAALKDTSKVKKEPEVAEELPIIPKEFAVYSIKPKTKGKRMKLCVNLVNDTVIFNHCVNDSLCKDPEIAKVIFEHREGDTLYVMVNIEAFTKVLDKPECEAGKESKLFYARWNTKTNKAVIKQRNYSSCMRGMTNMTKEPVGNWDGKSPLILNFHRGDKFVELKFDPQQYLLGIQSNVSENN